jgi:Predicted integral membrane protein
MRALASGGDVSGALNHARTFEALVKEEIGTPADAAVLAYAAELRTNPPPQPSVAVPAGQASSVSAPAKFDSRSSRASDPGTIPRSRPAPSSFFAAFAFVGVGLLLAVVGGALYVRSDRSSAQRSARISSAVPSTKDPSIAVLAFENASRDSAVEYYSYGLTDALIDRLTSSGSLRVIQGPSAFVLRGHRTDTRGIADSLGVSNILASGVLIEGKEMRVSVKLINGPDGSIRWSRTYHGNWDNRFVLQDSIETEVPRELALRVTGAPQGVRHKFPRTARAYELYLRGRHQWNAPAVQPMTAMRTAIGYFKGALAEDSTYAEAYAGLAASYLIIATGNLTDFDPRVAGDSARVAATKAVFYNDSLPEAHSALATVKWLIDYDWPMANAELKKAHELNPYYSRAPLWASVYYEWTNQLQAAVDEAANTVSTDPLSPNAVVEYARALYYAGRLTEAKAQVERARSLDSIAERLNLTSGEIYLKEKNYPLALREFERFARLTHRSSRAIALQSMTLAASGDRPKAQAILTELLARMKQGKATSFDLAIAYSGLGDFDNAFVYLNRSFEDQSMRPLIRDPSFSALQRDPRFAVLLKRMKLPR